MGCKIWVADFQISGSDVSFLCRLFDSGRFLGYTSAFLDSVSVQTKSNFDKILVYSDFFLKKLLKLIESVEWYTDDELMWTGFQSCILKRSLSSLLNNMLMLKYLLIIFLFKGREKRMKFHSQRRQLWQVFEHFSPLTDLAQYRKIWPDHG